MTTHAAIRTLAACAFFSSNCAFGLGDTARHRAMGAWSDGEPVLELSIGEATP